MASGTVLTDYLRRYQPQLFALLDAARDERIAELLRWTQAERACLFEGELGEALAGHGPWLVSLAQDDALLNELVAAGWGHSWGCYVISRRPFVAMKRHWRQFLLVRDAEERELLFRFYDPRVLRAFLPTASSEQREAFFDGVDGLLLEDEPGTALLVFSADEAQKAGTAIPLEC